MAVRVRSGAYLTRASTAQNRVLGPASEPAASRWRLPCSWMWSRRRMPRAGWRQGLPVWARSHACSAPSSVAPLVSARPGRPGAPAFRPTTRRAKCSSGWTWTWPRSASPTAPSAGRCGSATPIRRHGASPANRGWSSACVRRSSQLAGMPMNSPPWVPVAPTRATALSPLTMTSCGSALADHYDPLRSDHMRASSRSSSSVQPRVAASWNMAWNSVESIVGSFSATHFWLNRCGTLKIATRRP